ncbi:MAG: potassium transporter KefA [Alkaliphilus sp.]|nr:TrkH family potassium uptake protein [bacterium AH-315-L21]MBN4056570.1 TrkH family potassium uptake protein [bacterium AH-315-K05]MBN4069638.1 TrkH family potassium uptake protein [bacterium AH-315-G05]MBN4074295.1 TrkH family potassium uptake protein [bacterium AH-315-E09]PHS31794.1 MAG: potassium transporter KefA [Alkaliphilus sp.]
MNYGIVTKILGNLLLFNIIALLPSIGISIYYGENDYMAFILTIIIILLFSVPMSLVKPNSKKIRGKEALLIVAFGWLLFAAFGALPFVISGSIPSYVDAFFETISGLTTTGATILNDIEILPRGILFWRSLTHWLGGMGILVLTLAILPLIGVGGVQIFKAESPGPEADKLAPRMRDTAKILYTAYLGITIAQVTLLSLGGMSLYEAFVHTFGTVGTGGFSTRNASIGAFNSVYIEMVITFFMIASGVNFSLYYGLYKGRWKDIYKNAELRLYLTIIIIAFILISINLYGETYSTIGETLRYSIFQVGSIITTTGYTTTDFDLWPTFSRGILFTLMFIGGCAGSTGGAIKNIRILILLKLVKREFGKIIRPRALIPVRIQKKLISTDIVASVTSFFFLYILIFIGGTLLISLEGIGLVSSASAVAATLGNIGPGFDLVGATRNYSFFSVPSKLLLSLLMLLGRLELFTILVIMTPNFWRKEI